MSKTHQNIERLSQEQTMWDAIALGYNKFIHLNYFRKIHLNYFRKNHINYYRKIDLNYIF